MPWDLIVKAVQAVTDCRWVLLYVKRWLAAPLQYPDGVLVERYKGTPQGSAISPILANLFMHYAFDHGCSGVIRAVRLSAMDDAIVHCKSRRQAELVLAGIARGWRGGPTASPRQDEVVYCKGKAPG